MNSVCGSLFSLCMFPYDNDSGTAEVVAQGDKHCPEAGKSLFRMRGGMGNRNHLGRLGQ